MNKKGFTLIELMIVIAIIAIIAAIAIPGLLRARISANEGSAIGTLRTVSTSMAQCQSNAVIDQDADGTGEYALLQELSGVYFLPIDAAVGTQVANPAYITRALAPNAGDSYAAKSGYYYRAYLPGVAAAITETGANRAGATADANVQEVKWRAYAWPASHASSGNRAFAIDQAGEVYANANTIPTWNGQITGMEFNSAAGASTDTTFADSNMPNNDTMWRPAS